MTSPVPPITALGAIIRERRGGWTQARLAKKLGVPPSTLARIERGTHAPSADTAAALAEWLGWSAQEVLAAARSTSLPNIAAGEVLLGSPRIDTDPASLFADMKQHADQGEPVPAVIVGDPEAWWTVWQDVPWLAPMAATLHEQMAATLVDAGIALAWARRTVAAPATNSSEVRLHHSSAAWTRPIPLAPTAEGFLFGPMETATIRELGELKDTKLRLVLTGGVPPEEWAAVSRRVERWGWGTVVAAAKTLEIARVLIDHGWADLLLTRSSGRP
jgi:transcriptional regulator with XRE-family HTH domain